MIWKPRVVGIAVCCLLLGPRVVDAQVAAPRADARLTPRPVAAVLPFANISGHAADGWISEGIAETVLADLERGGQVSVLRLGTFLAEAGRQGTPLSEGDDRAAIEIGRRLGVSWLVRGGYQRVGDQVRITARVVDVQTGLVAKTVKADGAMSRIFELQDRLVLDLGADLGNAQPPALARANPSEAPSSATPGRTAAVGTEGSGKPAPAPATGVPRVDAGMPRPSSATVPAVAPGPAVSGPPAGVVAAPLAGGGRPLAIVGPPPPLPPAVVARDAAGGATVRAVRVSQPLRIDGNLDESLYAGVSITDFVQIEPVFGVPATEKTEVWLGFDKDNVYVALRCWESQPERRVASEMRRDSRTILQEDKIEFAFDTFYDRRNGVVFAVNAAGGRVDGQVTNERAINLDWNPVWNLAVGRFAGGWTVEAAMPFKSLRYRSNLSQVWGFHVNRLNRAKNERSSLTLVARAVAQRASFQFSQAATLVGIEAPPPARTVEVKPYVTGNVTTDRNAVPQVTNDPGGDFGFDAKIGVTQGLTADFTYNTDFAQVEADEQQVNLTRFSLFFPEKREFFLENQGLFGFGGVTNLPNQGPSDTPTLFYSRRIGLDQGRQVPIDGGGRMTGRVGRYGVGAMSIQSGDVPGTTTRATNFSVVRVKRDVLRRSSIGLIATGRSVSQSGRGRNLAYGADGTFAFFQNLAINTYWARTDSDGNPGDNVSYRGQLDYAGDRYGVQAERLVIGSHFNPEVGFIRRADIHRNFGLLRFSPRPKGSKVVRRYTFQGSLGYTENGEGRKDLRIGDGEFDIEMQNGDKFIAGYAATYEFLPAPFRIATGVTLPVGGYDYSIARVGYNFGQQRKESGNLLIERGTFYNGRRTTVALSSGRVSLASHLSVEPTYSINRVDLVQGQFTTHLAGSRVTYTATPLMFVSSLLQYNSGTQAVSANVRLRWEYRPGSEMFIVYNEERDTLVPTFPVLTNRGIIFKINRLFRF